MFNTYHLSNDNAEEAPSPVSDTFNLSNPSMGINDLACSAFDFMTSGVRGPKAKKCLEEEVNGGKRGTALMQSILRSVMDYTQVTRSDVSSCWQLEEVLIPCRRKNGWRMLTRL
jgi:hypothetical protein